MERVKTLATDALWSECKKGEEDVAATAHSNRNLAPPPDSLS